MTTFFDVLTEKLAERWLALITLPGAAFLAGLWIARVLGQSHALDLRLLAEQMDSQARGVSAWAPGAQVLGLLVLVGLAAAVGAVITFLATATERVWLGDVEEVPGLGRIARRMASRQEKLWEAALHERDANLRPENPSTPYSEESRRRRQRAERAMRRIAPARPARATWTGNRMHAAERSIVEFYELDLARIWPSLWMVLPEEARADIASAHRSFAAARIRVTWSLPWVLLGVSWWPAGVVAVVLLVAGWRQGRAAIGTLADLAEAAVDVYAPKLAVHLGVTPIRAPVTVETGRRIDEILRKNR